jgi:hypothetical protein
MLPDGTTTPNPNANFLQAGCETGFNTGNLPGPMGPCSGSAVSFAQGRNRFRYSSYFNTDFTIMKNKSIVGRDKVVLGIGFQFFNFFNHPNFGPPDNHSSDPSFGHDGDVPDQHFGIWSRRRCFPPDDPTESADPVLDSERMIFNCFVAL